MATLRFKKDGTPFVDFRADGKRHRPEFLSASDAQKFRTLADANPEEALRFWKESVETTQQGRSLVETADAFKEHYCGKRRNHNDMRRTMDRFVSFVLNARGEIKDLALTNLTLEDFEGFQSHLIEGGVANSSVNRYFTTVKTFWKRCVCAGYVDRDFPRLVKALPEESVQREAWKDEDTPKLIAELLRKEADPVLVEIARSMPFTPFGPVDFQRLKWRMMNFERGEIATFRMKGRGRRDWFVPMALGYQALLKEIKRRHEAVGLGGPNDFVYLDRDYKSPSTVWVSKSLERARKAVGITTVPYSSRHRIISLINQKAGIRTASQFGGHASIKTTEKHYIVGGDEDFRKKVNEALN